MYLIVWFWVIFNTLGVYAALIISMDSFEVTGQLLFFPIFMSSVTVCFCGIGQHLKDSVSSIQLGQIDALTM